MTIQLNNLYISTCFGLPSGSAQQGLWFNTACVDIRERDNQFHEEFTRTCAELKPEDFPGPLIGNRARDDYRLRSNSPAFKLGFQPIPMDTIGPRKRRAE